MKEIRRHLLCVSFGLFALSASVCAQYPETLWVPVTYYDFHWNTRTGWDQPVTVFRGNPDFEPPSLPNGYGGAITPNLVATTLDAAGKPMLGTGRFFNLGIAFWFRSWEDSAQGINSTFTYNASGNGSPRAVTHDTAFKNLTIMDALPMILVNPAAGVYQFDSETDEPYATKGGFFPLDGRGFSTEGVTDNAQAPWGHNYAFTMETRNQFRYTPGLAFDFRGDSDVWVFINGHLVLDLGGIHGPVPGSFVLDARNAASLELVPNEIATISVFYVERHVTGSNLQLTTNILRPTSLYFNVSIETLIDSLEAGVPAQIMRAHVLDSFGNDVTYSVDTSSFVWSIISSTFQPGDSLLNFTGATVAARAIVSGRDLGIRLSYTDPQTRIQFSIERSIRVGTSTGTIFHRAGNVSQPNESACFFNLAGKRVTLKNGNKITAQLAGTGVYLAETRNSMKHPAFKKVIFER